MIVQGLNHKGFAFIDIFQPFVTVNNVNTYQWYREHIYALGPDHDVKNRSRAFEKALEWGSKVPTGIFYQEEKPTYEDQTPQIQTQSLVEQDLQNTKVNELMEDLV